MKIIIDHPNDYARNLLRRCGYAAFSDPRTNERSYTRRLSGNFYPRFHAYVKETDERLMINLHLDQKKPSYKGVSHAHSGEYDGKIVEQEAQWLKGQIEKMMEERKGENA